MWFNEFKLNDTFDKSSDFIPLNSRHKGSSTFGVTSSAVDVLDNPVDTNGKRKKNTLEEHIVDSESSTRATHLYESETEEENFVPRLESLETWLGRSSSEDGGKVSRYLKDEMNVQHENSFQQWINNRDPYSIFSTVSSFSYDDAQKPFGGTNTEKYFHLNLWNIDLERSSFAELDTYISNKYHTRNMTDIEYRIHTAVNNHLNGRRNHRKKPKKPMFW